MVTALVVSDEEDRGLRAGARPDGIDLIVSAGDLPFDYLTDLADRLGCPGVLVPGNHDPDLTGFRERRGIWFRDGLPAAWPGPAGFDDADGRVVDVAGDPVRRPRRLRALPHGAQPVDAARADPPRSGAGAGGPTAGTTRRPPRSTSSSPTRRRVNWATATTRPTTDSRAFTR